MINKITPSVKLVENNFKNYPKFLSQHMKKRAYKTLTTSPKSPSSLMGRYLSSGQYYNMLVCQIYCVVKLIHCQENENDYIHKLRGNDKRTKCINI